MSEDTANQATSARDVFVSYASQDAAVANAVVEHLEQQLIKCWMVPRDVKPGAQYADAIVRAINDAKTLVLVLSQSSIGSSHVGREVERAASKRKQIIALKIDAASLTPTAGVGDAGGVEQAVSVDRSGLHTHFKRCWSGGT